MKSVVQDKFFAYLRSTSLGRGRDRDHVYLGQAYGRNCLLLGWSHQPYEEAIRAVQETHLGISDRAIGRALVQSMVTLFDQHNVRKDADTEADAPTLENILPTLYPSAVIRELANLLRRLKSSVKSWTAFVFLEGIELRGLRCLSLGEATLFPKDQGPLVDALSDMDCIEGFDDVTAWVRESIGHCPTYLVIDFEGENSHVDEDALHEAQHVASVINRYTVSARHRHASYERIGVLGQPTSTRGQLVVKRTPPVGQIGANPYYACYGQAAPGRQYRIDRTTVDRWREAGLDKVVQCLQLREATPGSAEARISNSITWYGRAMNAHTQDEQFAGLFIALESLLVADREVRNVTQRLADVTSSLLGSDLESRESLAKRTKELYEVRGRLVHGGVPVSRESLFALDEMVAESVLAFVRREAEVP